MSKDYLGESMERGRIIHLTGEIDGLGVDLITKLIHEGFEVTLQKEHLDNISNILRLELTHLSAGVKLFDSSTISSKDLLVHLSPNHEIGDLVVEIASSCPSIVVTTGLNHDLNPFQFSDTVINLHDLIPSVDSDNFPSNNLDSILKSCYQDQQESNLSDLPVRYWWLSQQDAVVGLVGFVKCTSLPKGIIAMCGRREWSVFDTYDQLNMLYQRTLAGVSGHFSSDHLKQSPVIGAGVKPVGQITASKRPDLSQIHEVMLESNEGGWRPLVPLRTSLMYYLAAKLE